MKNSKKTAGNCCGGSSTSWLYLSRLQGQRDVTAIGLKTVTGRLFEIDHNSCHRRRGTVQSDTNRFHAFLVYRDEFLLCIRHRIREFKNKTVRILRNNHPRIYRCRQCNPDLHVSAIADCMYILDCCSRCTVYLRCRGRQQQQQSCEFSLSSPHPVPYSRGDFRSRVTRIGDYPARPLG